MISPELNIYKRNGKTSLILKSQIMIVYGGNSPGKVFVSLLLKGEK